MNTPGHAILNLALLGSRDRPERSLPIFVGAVIPDVPIFVFFVWERFIEGMPDRLIWAERYFDPGWQRWFDLVHSIPLALLGYVAARRRHPLLALASASVLLHSICDLPLHHDDAHRHFLPFSSWRYVSPVSYWDPARHGGVAALCELIAVTAAAVVLWRRLSLGRTRLPPTTGTRVARAALVLVVALYVLAYGALYVR
jgi:hypothetical protein